MNDRHEDVHEIKGPRQRLHPQYQGREVHEHHQAHQPKQDGLITNNCLIVGLLIIVIALVIVVSIGLGAWLYQCNTAEKECTKINEKFANCQKQLNSTELLLKDEKEDMKNLKNNLESEKKNHETCKIELAKCGVYKERPRIEGEGVDAGWEEKYEECVRNSKETSKKLQDCQGNDTIE